MIDLPMGNRQDRSYEIGNHQAPHSWGFLFVGGWVDFWQWIIYGNKEKI